MPSKASNGNPVKCKNDEWGLYDHHVVSSSNSNAMQHYGKSIHLIVVTQSGWLTVTKLLDMTYLLLMLSAAGSHQAKEVWAVANKSIYWKQHKRESQTSSSSVTCEDGLVALEAKPPDNGCGSARCASAPSSPEASSAVSAHTVVYRYMHSLSSYKLQ